MKNILLVLIFVSATHSFAAIDCSEAYQSSAACEVVECDAKYKTFIGTWKGPFEVYAEELSTPKKTVYRPYQNTITYDEKDCLENIDNGDRFIIGRRTDAHPQFLNLPAKTTTGLLITGKRNDNTPFLRTIDAENGVVNYSLEYKNEKENLSSWSVSYPATEKSPEMNFSTLDAQDFTEIKEHKRNVTVTLTIGPKNSPLWKEVIVKGYHTLQKKN